MKRPSVWAAIAGTILIALFGYGAADNFINPTPLHLVNIAMGVSNFLWIALGFFLIYLFIQNKQKEDAGHELTKYEPNSPEDINSLRTQRRWIFIFLLLIELIVLPELLILNDYTAGPTLMNITVIFETIANTLFLFVVAQLMRGKDNILRWFLYLVIVYALVGAFLDVLRDEWVFAITEFLVAAYFVFAITAPLNRKNHRIAHFVILPIVVIVIVFVMPYLANRKIDELIKKDILLEQQYMNQVGTLAGLYGLFLQKDTPAASDIREIQIAVKNRLTKLDEINANLDDIAAEYRKQLPTVAQQKTLERFRFLKEIFDIHRAESEKITELVTYVQGVDVHNLSEEQVARISTMRQEVEGFAIKITDKQFELENAHLE